MDDVHYLLPLAAKLEEELERVHRRDWFRQSCERAIELAAAERERDQDELWRIGGAGALGGGQLDCTFTRLSKPITAMNSLKLVSNFAASGNK